MNRSQKYISILLERLPKWELRSYEHQTSLDRIRDRVTSASDIDTELNSLYQVKGFAEFALSLMWIADKVEKDATLDESTLAEETLVFEKLRYALGDISAPSQESTSTTETVDLPSLPGFESTSSPALEGMSMSPSEPLRELTSSPEPEATPEVLLDSWGKEPQAPTQTPSMGGSTTMGREQEHGFATLLERFLESVQSGNDDRTTLLSDVINECNTVVTADLVPEDYKQFCQLLVEFLQYISGNQYLDDIRVMNIVSNIQDPVNQWARSEQNNRTGLLDPAIEILRDFKTMFE
jgi:hypothetical protein